MKQMLLSSRELIDWFDIHESRCDHEVRERALVMKISSL